MRVTLHNGRGGAKHNARGYNTQNDSHINAAQTQKNIYYKRTPEGRYIYAPYTKRDEIDHYKAIYGDHIERQNAKARASRHIERVKTVEDYYRAHEPEETLIYFGDIGRELFKNLLEDYLRAMKRMEPYITILDAAIHCDEQGMVHAHIRRCYQARDDQGITTYHKTRALNQAGWKNQKNERYDNALRDWTATERTLLQKLAQKRGLDITTVPRKKEESGRTLSQYQREEALKTYLRETGQVQDFNRWNERRKGARQDRHDQQINR